ncbi:MAG TPA: hypothetical protein VKU80_13155 [Planctomycetota bacterium]|nr:hypothetical protein [Planctomycetota bacterium]
MRSAKRPESHPIRDGMAQALRGAGGIFTESSEAVARAVTAAIHEAGMAGDAAANRIAEVIKSAVGGIDSTEEDSAAAIKGICVGVLRGTRESGAAASRTIVRTSGTVIRETLRRGGDVAHATRGLVRGAVHGAKELGLDASEAASSAASAALDAAEESGAAAAERVRAAVEDTVDGFRVILRRKDRQQGHP